jgi:uncharacterized protein YjiS (DUF1127 family)
MTELILPFTRPFAGGGARSIAGMAAKAFAVVRKRRAIRATVAELRSLDDRTLSDIGLDRSEIESIAWVGFDRSAAANMIRSMPRESRGIAVQAGTPARASLSRDGR